MDNTERELMGIRNRQTFEELQPPLQPYASQDVGGWVGWYEDADGNVIAFEANDGERVFDW